MIANAISQFLESLRVILDFLPRLLETVILGFVSILNFHIYGEFAISRFCFFDAHILVVLLCPYNICLLLL